MPFELAKMNICCLRGPLGWLTQQPKPKIPSKLAQQAARYNEFGCNVVRNNELVAYTDGESLVLADVFGSLGLDLVRK